MANFDESRFRNQVNNALERIKTVLTNERHPCWPADVSHRYEDKFSLAEHLTATALAAQLNCFEALGIKEKELAQLKEWSRTRSVTLRFQSQENCAFVREKTKKVKSSNKGVTKVSSGGSSAKITSEVVTKVTEYFWKFDANYALVAFQGNNVSEAIELQSGSGTIELVSTVKKSPHPDNFVLKPIDVNITWLLQRIGDQQKFEFCIDRDARDCHTPRRNADVIDALCHFSIAKSWAAKVALYFQHTLLPKQSDRPSASVSADSIFVPVVPLFELLREVNVPASSSLASASSSLVSVPNVADAEAPLLSAVDMDAFLAEQKRSMAARFVIVDKEFPADTKLSTATEAKLLVTLGHAVNISKAFSDSVDYIERMLYNQLVAAIGKVVTPADFAEYMRFHNRKLFRDEFQPTPFAYAVRRVEHCPEGTLSIESQLADGSLAQPIFTAVNQREATQPMQFALSAAVNVQFLGRRYVHAYVMNSFSGASGQQLNLTARARQFSSFVLLIGRIASARVFEPTGAIIVKNKDDLKVALDLETIPTPKEFRDAIESLSPEQQAFAKAFRAMQLESTLFGVLVIQIKPQLEKLMNLPADSLTKEIRLNEDLLELFLEYQIPSDLLSYDGNAEASVASKVNAVRTNAATLMAMIEKQRQEVLRKAAEERAMREAEERTRAQVQAVNSRQVLLGSVLGRGSRRGVARGSGSGFRGYGGGSRGRGASSGASRGASCGAGRGGGAARGRFAVPVANAIVSPSTPTPVAPTTVTNAPAAASTSSAPEPAAVNEKTPSTTVVGGDEDESDDLVDYTKIPAALDAQFEKLDEDSALRPTIIKPAKVWTKSSRASLLSRPVSSTLNVDAQRVEKNRAFDLLDALSRSGALTVDEADLHVVIASTHCFDKSLIDTVIEDNVNPIEKVERSTLIVASTIQDCPVEQLIRSEHIDDVRQSSPMLF